MCLFFLFVFCPCAASRYKKRVRERERNGNVEQHTSHITLHSSLFPSSLVTEGGEAGRLHGVSVRERSEEVEEGMEGGRGEYQFQHADATPLFHISPVTGGCGALFAWSNCERNDQRKEWKEEGGGGRGGNGEGGRGGLRMQESLNLLLHLLPTTYALRP